VPAGRHRKLKTACGANCTPFSLVTPCGKHAPTDKRLLWMELRTETQVPKLISICEYIKRKNI
jgi:hypothetical protein